MANTAGRKAGDPAAIAGQVVAGEKEDTRLGFSSPNWKKDAAVITAWKKD